ncbi:UvrB/UvrC motif-containing protein [Litoribacter populi]|uniref:UvrB/UvrC motif-containing protein n=1 Tax=Litoribacter populi TaxID=2598460 RepID=UPI00117E4B4A|nr:UvrB/UvrC motif-containing protein [Litoribacter populi]
MDFDHKLDQLNSALAASEPDWALLRQLIQELTDQAGLKLKVLDFEFYNDARLEYAEKEKDLATRRQAYEEASIWRDKVREIQKHIDLRNDLSLTTSSFRVDHGHLFYFHTGKGLHDQQVLELLAH